MFEQEFYDLIRSHLETELKTQDTYLRHELIDIGRSAMATGTWDSEEYYKDLSTHLRDHAIRSLQQLFQTLLKVVSARVWDLDREVAEELMQIISFYGEQQKEHLGQFLPMRWEELSGWSKAKEIIFGQNIRRHPGGVEWRERIDLTIDDFLRRYNQDIEFMLVEEQHKKNTERGVDMSKASINITGPVTSITTGNGNIVISTQKNIQPITRELNDVLKLVEDGVAQARSDLSPSNKADIMASVAKCRSELAQCPFEKVVILV